MKFKRKFYRMLKQNRQYFQLLKIMLMICVVVLAGAIGVLAVEYKSSGGVIKDLFDAIWWALVTITTVGYGDLVPVTFWGRIIGIVFIFLGFTIFSAFTAFIASSFIDKKIKERKGLNKIRGRNHVLICGWNKSAQKILDFMNKRDPATSPSIVLVNELEEGDFTSIQNRYPDLQLGFIRGDFTNQEILAQGNAKEAKHIILLFDESKANIPPSDERTIIAAHNLTYLKLKGKISIQLHDEKYLSALRRQNIQNIIIYDDLGGNLLGYSTVNPTVPDFLQAILKNEEGKSFKEVDIPSEFVDKPYKELCFHMKEVHNYLILGVVSTKPEVSIDQILSEDASSIDRFIKQQFEQSGKQFSMGESVNNIKIKPDDSYIIQESDKAIVL
ncbi:MAG: ion channel [Candidatus Cloacimonadales bacterium]|nr:ion channel [Candidatus Cloacimonadales bacterium]